jgi:hypothetical protein
LLIVLYTTQVNMVMQGLSPHYAPSPILTAPLVLVIAGDNRLRNVVC